jgi:general secretion pathway protein B
MSYILEALKKLEQKREREESGRAPTFMEDHRREPARRQIWPYIVVSALVLNAIILVWFSPWQSKERISSARAGQAPKQPVPMPATKPDAAATKDVIPEQMPVQSSRAAEKRRHPLPMEPGEHTAIDVPPPSQHRASDQEPQSEQVRQRKALPPGSRLLAIDDLPSSVRTTLPQFRISGHAYSTDVHTRVVMLNDRVLRERQELSPGLKVEEIVPDGIVMSYQGYRFKIVMDNVH